MNKETLFNAIKTGAIIPGAFIVYPVGCLALTITLLTFQLACMDLYRRFRHED